MNEKTPIQESTVNFEALATEARSYLPDILSKDSTGDPYFIMGAITDVASFGYPEDIERVESVLLGIYGSIDLQKPMDFNVTQYVSMYVQLAAQVGGEYLQTAKDIVELIPHEENSANRESLLVSLAKSGNDTIFDQALTETLAYPGDEETQGNLLVTLQKYRKKDLSPYIISLTKDVRRHAAVDILLSDHGKPLPESALREAESRVQSVNWEELDVPDEDYDQLDEDERASERNVYIRDLAKVYRANSNPHYKDLIVDYIDLLPDTGSKLSTLSECADVVDNAPNRIISLAKQIDQTDELSDKNKYFLVSAYAGQKKYEQAEKLAETIPTQRYYLHAYSAILVKQGVHLIDKVIEVNVANKRGNSAMERDSGLMGVAFIAAYNGFLSDTLKVLEHLEDPISKIKVLSNVARVAAGGEWQH